MIMMKWSKRLAVGLHLGGITLSLVAPVSASGPDHGQWDTLIKRHVHWLDSGHASVVDYTGMGRDRALLEAYLERLSAVEQGAFTEWPKPEQLAFLINAYNAFTVQLILTRYPGVTSIKQLGTVLQSPWKKPFVFLLGARRSLDDIEHGLIRGSGRYRDPRVHFALNCASIGCPALRPEAYTADRLEAQLEDQARRFLSDRSRNRFEQGRLVVSPIFKWYRRDFETDGGANRDLHVYLARYAADLGLNDEQGQALASGRIPITFGDYDWRLNDARGAGP